MKRDFLKALLITTCLLAGAFASDDPTESLDGVLDLTPDTFDSHVNGGKFALVEFYAPWCGHCKRLVPEYKRLGEAIKADPKLASRVVIAKVNADDHRSLGERFGVRGFPTLKFFSRGQPVDKPEDYNGGRTLDAFLKFIGEKVDADKTFARVEGLDALAAGFVEAADKEAVVKEAETKVAALEGEAATNGELYVRFMKKAIEKGSEYLAKELARLERVVASGSASSAKLGEMLRKVSVLSAFSGEEATA